MNVCSCSFLLSNFYDNLPQTIEKLSNIGVRFVYYSPYNYRHSRKLASRMGLETGWNTAISLSDEVFGR